VLLDANALLLPFRERFPLRAELEQLRPGAELVVPVSVLRELDALVERGVREAEPARELARTFRALPTSGRGDVGILRAAVETGAWVATADRALARRLAAAGVTVLAPRDRARLEVRLGEVRRSGAERRRPGPSPLPRSRARRGKG
jgi:rRNA-processing protein FCF1